MALQKLKNPTAHFTRSFVREGNGKDLRRMHAVLIHQIRHPMR
jgi:hypothetical protein